MEPSLWEHHATDPITSPVVRDMTVQAFASGVLVGIVVVAAVLMWHRSRSRLRPLRRGMRVVSGWGDLFRLGTSVARGVLWLLGLLLLLGRIVFWPMGRRW